MVPLAGDVPSVGAERVAEGGRPTGTAGPLRLVFGRELIDMPQRLILVRGDIRVDVTGDGGGRYFASAP